MEVPVTTVVRGKPTPYLHIRPGQRFLGHIPRAQAVDGVKCAALMPMVFACQSRMWFSGRGVATVSGGGAAARLQVARFGGASDRGMLGGENDLGGLGSVRQGVGARIQGCNLLMESRM